MPVDYRELEKEFEGQFMEPFVWQAHYWEVETSEGTFFFDPDEVDVETAVDGDVYEKTFHEDGWLCWLTAPGYLDHTAMVGFETEQECVDYLLEQYGE